MRVALAIAVLLVLSACGSDQQNKSLAPLPKLETLTVAAGDASAGRSWDGVVQAVRQADLSAQTSGRVTVVAVDVNARVAKGDVLVRLTAVEQDAGASAAKAQLRSAEAGAVEAQASYARYQSLASKQFVSQLQLDQARATRDAAVANRDAARAQLAQAGQQSEYTMIRAPFDGIVSARSVEPGESVAPGRMLLSVYAPGALRIEVQVPQSDADAIRAANKARVVLADGRRVDAAAVTVFPAADPMTHSVGIRVDLPDLQDAPQPGVTAKVVFPIAVGAMPLQVPSSAVVQRGEVSAVYIITNNQISLRQVRLGQRVGDQVEVLAGLKSGDAIAVDPVAALSASAAQRAAAGDSNE
jgi:RND family efflux transporter MFP subunit